MRCLDPGDPGRVLVQSEHRGSNVSFHTLLAIGRIRWVGLGGGVDKMMPVPVRTPPRLPMMRALRVFRRSGLVDPNSLLKEALRAVGRPRRELTWGAESMPSACVRNLGARERAPPFRTGRPGKAKKVGEMACPVVFVACCRCLTPHGFQQVSLPRQAPADKGPGGPSCGLQKAAGPTGKECQMGQVRVIRGAAEHTHGGSHIR